jgi:cytochrome c
MDDRSNTIAGWVLGAGIAALGFTILSGELGHSETPEEGKFGYAVEAVVEGGELAAAIPLPTLLAAADVTKGEAVFKKCTACHSIASGGANGIGPNLWGSMGKGVGAHAGFAYSDSLKAVGGTWTFEQMNAWLTAPKKFASGTKMSFAGLGKAEDRANVIAYLNSQGSNLPLPKADAAPAAGAAVDPKAAPADAGTVPATAPAGANAASPADTASTPAPVK